MELKYPLSLDGERVAGRLDLKYRSPADGGIRDVSLFKSHLPWAGANHGFDG